MSAAALRAPASPWRVAVHYLRLMARGSTGVGVVFAAGAVYLDPGGTTTAAQYLLPMVLFLPLLHWREWGRPGALDTAMPLDRRGHLLLRVACGAAWAVATLVPPAVLIVLDEPVRGPNEALAVPFPAWFPAAVVVLGLTLYLLGSAVWLRTERAAPWLLVVALVGLPLVLLVLPGWVTKGMFTALSRTTASPGAPMEWPVGFAEWLASASIGLALATACVTWSVVVAGADRARARGAGPATAPPEERRPPTVAEKAPVLRAHALPALRMPPGPGAVLRRHAGLLRRRVVLAAPVILLLTLWPWLPFLLLEGGGPGPGITFPLATIILGWFAMLWPLIVWTDEAKSVRGYEDALPVGMGTNRMARVAVGGASLLALAALVVAANFGLFRLSGVPAPAAGAHLWAGIPLSALAGYLLGSVPVLLARRNAGLALLATHLFVGWRIFGETSLAARGPLPLGAAMSYAANPQQFPGMAWYSPLLLWLPLLAAAVCAAVVVRAEVDRRGGWRISPVPAAGPSR